MHPAAAFGWTDRDAMLAFADKHAFARVFATTPAGPRVAHAPLLVTPDGALRFHLANGNSLLPHIESVRVLALVEGPNAYVSANWYQDVRGAVPTWNYVAVEYEGPVRRLPRVDLIALLDALALKLEPTVGENWTRAKMEPRRFDAMLGAITACELMVEAIRGTRKLSQNQPDLEAQGVLGGMQRNSEFAMAEAIRGMRA